MPDDSTLDALRTALGAYIDPYAGQSLADAQAVREVKAAPNGGYAARIVLGFPVPALQFQETLVQSRISPELSH